MEFSFSFFEQSELGFQRFDHQVAIGDAVRTDRSKTLALMKPLAKRHNCRFKATHFRKSFTRGRAERFRLVFRLNEDHPEVSFAAGILGMGSGMLRRQIPIRIGLLRNIGVPELLECETERLSVRSRPSLYTHWTQAASILPKMSANQP